MADIYGFTAKTIDGANQPLADYRDKVLLVVNVASKCGLTPQYDALQKIHAEYADKGFAVLGFPCNQFAGQEPGSSDDIKSFCSMTYGVTFPLMEKVKVNGRKRHPLYVELTKVPDAAGKAGRVTWNFEKFVLLPDGEVARFRPNVQPDDPAVIAVIERGLAEAAAA